MFLDPVWASRDRLCLQRGFTSTTVGLVTTRKIQQLIPLNSHRWRPTSNRWLMKFRCAAPASVSFSLMSNHLETTQDNNKARNRETTMIYLLIKSRNHELSSKLHIRHGKSSLLILIINQEQSLQPSLDVASLLGGSNQYVSPSIHSLRMDLPKNKIFLSLTSFNTKLRALHNLLQAINNPTLVTLTPKLSTKLKSSSNIAQPKELVTSLS